MDKVAMLSFLHLGLSLAILSPGKPRLLEIFKKDGYLGIWSSSV